MNHWVVLWWVIWVDQWSSGHSGRHRHVSDNMSIDSWSLKNLYSLSITNRWVKIIELVWAPRILASPPVQSSFLWNFSPRKKFHTGVLLFEPTFFSISYLLWEHGERRYRKLQKTYAKERGECIKNSGLKNRNSFFFKFWKKNLKIEIEISKIFHFQNHRIMPGLAWLDLWVGWFFGRRRLELLDNKKALTSTHNLRSTSQICSRAACFGDNLADACCCCYYRWWWWWW